MNIFDHYRQRYEAAKDEEFTLQEFLTTCRQDRSAYANAAERLLMAIGEPVMVDTAQEPRLSRLFSNRVIARYPAFEEFYGMEDAIEQIVSYLKHAAQGLEEKKQILYLLGPVGGGKSSLAERLKSLMQLVPIYVLSANGERSPVNDHPFCLFNPQEDAQILEKENSNAEFIGLLRQERASLLELESDYKVSFKNYRLFDHVVRNFEIDAELIRRTRNAAKLTQEGLSEDICAQETLARIENGNQKPRSGNLRQMMEKMGRSGDRIETGIQVEEYETLELKIELSKFIHRKEYGNAEKVLSKIEEKLDCNLMKNYQYIETERVKVKYKENAEYTEQFIKQLKELLAMSLKVEEGQKIEYVLNTEEVSILTEMALIYWGEQNYKVALEIYQFLVGQYEKSFIKPVFHILDWGMSMGNYGMALEELGYFEKAIGVCRKRIQQTLFAGKGGSLHTSLMVEACILEAQKDVKCKKYFKQDLDLLRLYKMQTNYKLMESYVKTNKIFD